MDSSVHSLIEAIDRRIAERHLLLHPFYQCWTSGELSREALGDYAAQYYHHVAAFPTYLSAVHANTEEQTTRRQILANLIDEEAGDPNHPELWLRFAEGVGVTRQHVQQIELWAETRNLIRAFRSVCREGSTAEGLATLYAYESQVPTVAKSKIDGLKRFYKIDSPRALAYFEVHIQADERHTTTERSLLAHYLGAGNAAAVMR